MFGPLGGFLTNILQSATTVLTPLVVGFGLFVGGIQWASGEHRGAKLWIGGAIIGGAIMLLAPTMAQSMMAVGH